MTELPAKLQRIISRLWTAKEYRDDWVAWLWSTQHPTEKVSGNAVQTWRLQRGWRRTAYSRHGSAAYEPTEGTIRRECEQMQQGWTKLQLKQHDELCRPVPVGVLTVHVGQGQSTAAALLEAELVEVKE